MTGFPRTVRNMVLRRADGRCERCALWTDAVQLHHRRPRGMGGSKRADTNSPANALALCRRCHADVESMRADAYELGYLVSSLLAPEMVPVFRCGQWVNLDQAGGYRIRGGTAPATQEG